MFISANKRFKIRLGGDSAFIIPTGFVGEIPDEVASSWLIQAAIKDGSIVCPSSYADKVIEEAVAKGKEKTVKAAKKKESK